MSLQLQNITHYFESSKILDNISLSIDSGQVLCLLGPSGCGKTTLLRIVSGLEKLQQGRIIINGRTIAETGMDVPPEKRGVGFLFQDFALFPHLNVLENTMFGLSAIRDKKKKKEMALQALSRVDMSCFVQAHPHELSGGQQQRVALARALAPGPGIMLLDEPFSSLDTRLRSQVRDQTLHVLKKSRVATVMVTHDPEEAMFMGDHIVLINNGQILQEGDPASLYFKPANTFVATFFSEVNELKGAVAGGEVKTVFGAVPAREFEEGAHVTIMFRPESMSIVDDNHNLKGNEATGEIEASRLLLGSTLLHLRIPATVPGTKPVHIHAKVPGLIQKKEGDKVSLRLDFNRTFVFAADKSAISLSSELHETCRA